MSEFQDLLHLDSILRFLAGEGYKQPQAVQAATIPRMLKGDSVSVLAPTGSGKTLAYVLAIAQELKTTEDGEAAPLPRAPRAWVLVPTSELMEQVAGVFRTLAHSIKLRVRVDRPGSHGKQTQSRLSSQIDVLVTSPARALRGLERGTLRAEHARFLICDEADQLFDGDFCTQVGAVFSKLRSDRLQVGLFSATMPGWFESRRDEVFGKVRFESVVLQGSHRLKHNITTINRTVPFREKQEHTRALLARESMSGFVFVNQKTTANTLFDFLRQQFPDKHVGLLHGGMPKSERRTALNDFTGAGGVLVCTDVAARGLDLPNVDWILNYDMPFEPAYYMHRCGRAGRRGSPARVLNLVTTKDRPLLARINMAIEQQSSLRLSRVVAEQPRPKGEPSNRRTTRKQALRKSDSKARPGTAAKSNKNARPGARR